MDAYAVTSLLRISNQGYQLHPSLQEIDYLHHGFLVELVAATFNSVFCVSGTQTFVRLSAFFEVANAYFAPRPHHNENLYHYWRCELGDDRWLTQLLLLQSQGKSVLQLDTRVLNETQAAACVLGLLSQRLRWLLACTASDIYTNMNRKMFFSFPAW